MPILHDSACSTDILAPEPSHAVGMSNAEWLSLRRTVSLHLVTNRPVPFNRLGITESHAPCITIPYVQSCHSNFVLAAAVEKDLLIFESILSGHLSSLSGANVMCPKVEPDLGIHKRYRQVASCHKGGQMNTWGGVHQIAHCESPQLDAVCKELVVFPINISRWDTKEGRQESCVNFCLQG